MSIWRIEVLHPATVHFPIAFLTLGVLLRTLAFLPIGNLKSICQSSGRVLIALGTATAWFAVLAGDWAEEVVNQSICDPELTHEHGDWAERSTWIFTAVTALDILALDGIRRRFKIPLWLSRSATIVAVLASWFAFAILIRVAHLGATLTYQLGAGVQMPDAKCTGIGDEEPAK